MGQVKSLSQAASGNLNNWADDYLTFLVPTPNATDNLNFSDDFLLLLHTDFFLPDDLNTFLDTIDVQLAEVSEPLNFSFSDSLFEFSDGLNLLLTKFISFSDSMFNFVDELKLLFSNSLSFVDSLSFNSSFTKSLDTVSEINFIKVARFQIGFRIGI